MEMAIDTPSPAPSAASPAPSAATGRQTRAADSVRLEHQLVRVPLEALKATARTNHRLAEKEIAAVLSSASSVAAPDAVDHLTSLVSRLHGLKRKMEEGARAEELQVQRCRARLDRLAAASAGDDGEWEDLRLKRILVDYMLRMSYYDTATKLAETSGIQDLVDIDVFLDAKRVIDSLQNKEIAPALAWCAENKSRLKKSKVACRPLEGYRGGLRDEDLPRTARAGLWMSSGGLASGFVGGLLKTERLHVCRGCRELAAAPTALLGFGLRPEQQCFQLSHGGLAGFGWYTSWLWLAGSW